MYTVLLVGYKSLALWFYRRDVQKPCGFAAKRILPLLQFQWT